MVAADHQRDAERAGHRRARPTWSSSRRPDHLAAVRAGHRHQGDRGQAPGQGRRSDWTRRRRRSRTWPRLSTTSASPPTPTPRRGNFDAGGASFSETGADHCEAGAGASVASSGVTFTFPNVAAGTNDNTVAEGQTISLSGCRHTRFPGLCRLRPRHWLRDHHLHRWQYPELQPDAPDWFSTTPPSGGALAVSLGYQNRHRATPHTRAPATSSSVPVASHRCKSVASVTLPRRAVGRRHPGDLRVRVGHHRVPEQRLRLVSLRAHANGDIVTADNDGTNPLIANRTTLGTWDSSI